MYLPQLVLPLTDHSCGVQVLYGWRWPQCCGDGQLRRCVGGLHKPGQRVRPVRRRRGSAQVRQYGRQCSFGRLERSRVGRLVQQGDWRVSASISQFFFLPRCMSAWRACAAPHHACVPVDVRCRRSTVGGCFRIVAGAYNSSGGGAGARTSDSLGGNVASGSSSALLRGSFNTAKGV